jgi:hypothetical protein
LAPPRAGLFHFPRHGTCLARLRWANFECHWPCDPGPHTSPGGRDLPISMGEPTQALARAGLLFGSDRMFWSQLIRYFVLVGQIALAAGIAAVITMVLKYATG